VLEVKYANEQSTKIMIYNIDDPKIKECEVADLLEQDEGERQVM
jgi:hypothetical protein